MKKSGLRTYWLAAGALLAAVILSYGNSLSNDFHYDDIHIILRNPAVRSIAISAYSFANPSAFSLYRTPMIRPITLLTYAANYALGEFQPLGWRLVNLLILFVAALLVKAVVSELIRRRGRDDEAEMAGFFTALFFAVHPLNTEAVNYLSARSMLLMAMFYLLSIYLKFRERAVVWRFASWLAFILALLSREDAATLPVAVVLVDLLAPEDVNREAGITLRGVKSRIKFWLPYWLILGAYFIYRKEALGTAISEGFVRTIPENLKLQVWALGIYQKLLIWPRGLSISHPVSENLAWTPVWTGILILLILEAVIALASIRKRPLLTFAIGWYFLASSPSLLIPLNQAVAEHRVYLAMVGPALLAGIISMKIWKAGDLREMPVRGIGVICIMALILSLAIIARKRNTDWATEKSLWSSAVEVHPLDDKAWVLLGLVLKNERDYNGAIAAYRRAIAIEPTSGAYDNLSVACTLKLDHDCARKSLESSLALNPNDPIALSNYAEILLRDGKLDAAEASYRKALRLRPVFPEAHRNFAVFLFKTHRGSTQEIIEHLGISLSQDPIQPDADKLREAMIGVIQYNQFMENYQKEQNQKGPAIKW